MTSGTRSTEAITIRRRVPSGHIATAELEIRQPGGDLSPGFSLTGELRGTGGAVGDELAQLIPELAPFARLHLSDLDGVPMHAEANARYWHEQARGLRTPTDDYGRGAAEGVTPQEYSRRFACRALRVDALPAELDTLDAEKPYPEGRSAYELAFADFVDAQRPRWKQEADEARAVFDMLREQEAEQGAAEDTDDRAGEGRGVLDLASDHGSISPGDRFDSRELLDAQAEARLEVDDPDIDTDEKHNARRLVTLVDELGEEVGGDWHYGVQFIPESEFEDYAREFASEIGAINEDAEWPNSHIDWKAAAGALRQDYAETELDDVTYLYRA